MCRLCHATKNGEWHKEAGESQRPAVSRTARAQTVAVGLRIHARALLAIAAIHDAVVAYVVAARVAKGPAFVTRQGFRRRAKLTASVTGRLVRPCMPLRRLIVLGKLHSAMAWCPAIRINTVCQPRGHSKTPFTCFSPRYVWQSAIRADGIHTAPAIRAERHSVPIILWNARRVEKWSAWITSWSAKSAWA